MDASKWQQMEHRRLSYKPWVLLSRIRSWLPLACTLFLVLRKLINYWYREHESCYSQQVRPTVTATAKPAGATEARSGAARTR